MPPLDSDLVRHALDVARTRGFAEVELESAEGSFHAVLQPRKKAKPAVAGAGSAVVSVAPDTKPVKSTLVGYLDSLSIKVGDAIEKGQTVAVVSALGIANDVESGASGVVEEIHVEVGQPVEYGQALATVRPG